MTMAFVIASIAAFKLLRNRQPKDTVYHKKALKNVYDSWILFNITFYVGRGFICKIFA